MQGFDALSDLLIIFDEWFCWFCGFGGAQNDCIPLELIITMVAAILLLLVIYAVSPSIFSLVSSLDQDISGGGRNAKLLNGGGMRIEDWNEDEYDSDEDKGVTLIDISQSERKMGMQSNVISMLLCGEFRDILN